ncbi:hypothetical protein PMAYCL1PPCAC_27600 [Pristionchus mayeri]|uniref:Nuclear receptor n=1 Tax=Pristionchus mayeri TaxID=1317129 RepID=A0AAN5IAU1_9BILA|nr:hypothetical protein PMAYCL1PPCAC_27600 [Pristionchus mayeri]
MHRWNEPGHSSSFSPDAQNPTWDCQQSGANEAIKEIVLPEMAASTPLKSKNTTSSRINKEMRRYFKEPCYVCGGDSSGHHYNVPSCNGCKSFFRRTLLEQRQFVCEFDGTCDVLPKKSKEEKRRPCRACRFARCVKVGMNPQEIVIDETHKDMLVNAMRNHSMLPKKTILTTDDQAKRLIDGLSYMELKHNALRRSDFNPLPVDTNTIFDLLYRHSVMGESRQEMHGWPLEHNFSLATISLEEHAQLRIPLPAPNLYHAPTNFKFWFYVDLTCAIEWSKTLDFFRLLDIVDQRKLLIFSACQIANLTHSYFSYTSGSDRALFPDGRFGKWTPREAERDAVPIMLDLRLDRTEYLLLKLLVICNPSCETLSDHARAIIQNERNKFTKLLLNYCLSAHGKARGPSRFGEIIALESTLLQQVLSYFITQRSKNLHMLLVAMNLRPCRFVLLDEICEIK